MASVHDMVGRHFGMAFLSESEQQLLVALGLDRVAREPRRVEDEDALELVRHRVLDRRFGSFASRGVRSERRSFIRGK